MDVELSKRCFLTGLAVTGGEAWMIPPAVPWVVVEDTPWVPDACGAGVADGT